MAEALGIRAPEWSAKYTKRAGCPRRTLKGFDVKATREWYLSELRKSAGNQAGPNQDIKRTKIEKEVEKIERDILLRDLDIAEKRGELIDMKEHQTAMRELCAMFQDVFNQFIANVKVLTGSVKLVGEAERLKDEAWARMQKKVKK